MENADQVNLLLIVDRDRSSEIPTFLEYLQTSVKTQVVELNGDCSLDRIKCLIAEQPFDLLIADVRSSRVSRLYQCIAAFKLPALLALDSSADLAKAGLSDCLHIEAVFRPVREHDVRFRVDRLAAQCRAKRTLASSNGVGFVIGNNQRFREMVKCALRIAGQDVSVLIEGESGTGKELVARAIHEHSRRSDKQFVPLNCATIPDQLFENELFGHVKGAFTGARESSPGVITDAEGGTILLDEIDALSPLAQAKLLRVVQQKEFRTLGSPRARTADIRIISATNKDLRKLVAEGQFREDLFYRISTVQLTVPPLRERRNDIRVLAVHFLEKYAGEYGRDPVGLDKSALEKLQLYDWPGNIRELESVIQRAVLFSERRTIGSGELSPFIEGKSRTSTTDSLEGTKGVNVTQLLEVFRSLGGNVSETARAIGKPRRTIQRILTKHKIEREEFLSRRN